MAKKSKQQNKSKYVVVIRGPSGVHFLPDQRLPVNNFPRKTGNVDLIFRTRYVKFKEHKVAIPMGFWVDVRGPAPSLKLAIEVFTNAARCIAAIISVSSNAPVDDLEAELAFNITPGLKKREYFQQHLLEERIRPGQGRKVNLEAALGLLRAIGEHPEGDRLHRAATHYHHALQDWKPGHEINALAHIYIGMEALTPIARERHLEQTKMNKEQLIAKWNIEKDKLDPEVRRRILFQGDDESYRNAKAASDSYEHSYEPLPKVRTLAAAVREKTAHYLRSAIIDLAEVEASAATILRSPPFDKPLFWAFAKYMMGFLIGEGDRLAADKQEYPILRWKSKVKEVNQDKEGNININFEEEFSPRLAEGISFKPERFEVWGPSNSKTSAPKTLSKNK